MSSTSKLPLSSAQDTSFGSLSWSNISNIQADDGNSASCSLSTNNSSSAGYYLKGYNFGFSIPSNSVITGIEVTIDKSWSMSGKPNEYSGVADNRLRLIKNGTILSTDKADPSNWSSSSIVSYGGDGDLWGTTWTPAQINSSSFGLVFSPLLTLQMAAGSTITAQVDYISIKVYYSLYSSVSGTMELIFDGDSTRQVEFSRSENMLIRFSGTILGIIRPNTYVIETKNYIYKVYDENDNFLGVLDDVISEPNWSQEINSTGSSTTIKLARNSKSIANLYANLLDEDSDTVDDENAYPLTTTGSQLPKVGPSSNILTNNRVDIIAFYGELSPILDSNGISILDDTGDEILGATNSPSGRRVFTGFISETNVNYGGDETTDIQLMSYGYDLDQYLLIRDANTKVAFNSYYPTDIIKEIMDLFIAQGGEYVYTTYSAESVQDLDDYLVSYTFRSNTYKEVIQKCVELSPANWYYFVDLGTNELNFKLKETTAKHIFYLGKHIKELNLRQSIADVVNDVIFTGGGDPALYHRETVTPEAHTRRGLSQLSDGRVTLEDSANILSEGEINKKKNAQYRSSIVILDKVYDIESIKVGDTVGFRNFNNEIDSIIMQVAGLTYTPEAINLQLDTIPDNTNKRLEDIKRNLRLQENQNVDGEL